jgi:hypothetical protein
MHAGHVFKMGPDFVHLGDVQGFEGFVEALIGFGDFFDSLFDHAAPVSERAIILESSFEGEKETGVLGSSQMTCLVVNRPDARQDERDPAHFHQTDRLLEDNGRQHHGGNRRQIPQY